LHPYIASFFGYSFTGIAEQRLLVQLFALMGVYNMYGRLGDTCLRHTNSISYNNMPCYLVRCRTFTCLRSSRCGTWSDGVGVAHSVNDIFSAFLDIFGLHSGILFSALPVLLVYPACILLPPCHHLRRVRGCSACGFAAHFAYDLHAVRARSRRNAVPLYAVLPLPSILVKTPGMLFAERAAFAAYRCGYCSPGFYIRRRVLEDHSATYLRTMVAILLRLIAL